ncbi:hypothetical protein CPter291_1929 [Collimonas pratensis]|uniref:Uncharacterized protein n=1 Tax=Collimonas pratensis TaxID=279113 RepID=A0A127Q2Q8_9BURK|nr:hypothetical protein CPter91_1903 [Collimonas pratensis]AMP14195.1 hypothetical protein CPter291_1929 [Collimonas pratensis]
MVIYGDALFYLSGRARQVLVTVNRESNSYGFTKFSATDS